VVVERRPLVVCLLLAAVAAGVVVGSLVLGEIQVGLPRVWATLTGHGTAIEDLLVLDLRLPRVLTALLVGAALGMAGAIFQNISRNPLGSPDVIGFDYGSATGALVVMLFLDGSGLQTAAGAVVGGMATAALVYVLALRNGLDGLRLVLVGIGVGFALISVNQYLIVRSNLYDAQSAAVWLVGNLAGRGWDHVRLLAPALLVLVPLALLLARPLRMAELSDQTAVALGLRTERVRLAAVVVGVLLASVAVATAGPIAFIALTAPQIARRLTRVTGPNLVASGLTGAILLGISDWCARELFAPRPVPVGVLTGVVGGLYLAWLLTREWRKGVA